MAPPPAPPPQKRFEGSTLYHDDFHAHNIERRCVLYPVHIQRFANFQMLSLVVWTGQSRVMAVLPPPTLLPVTLPHMRFDG